jgi:hypothetical protein
MNRINKEASHKCNNGGVSRFKLKITVNLKSDIQAFNYLLCFSKNQRKKTQQNKALFIIFKDEIHI